MRKNHFGLLAILAMLCCVSLGATSPTTPPPTAPKTPPAKPAVARTPHVANTHLHGALPAVVKSAAKPVAKVADKVTERAHLARHWTGRWAFANWAVLHRGLGTIAGQVHTASGAPASGVRVALRSAKGKVLGNAKARHVTHTGPGGTFLMTNVRIGNYRVRATKGKTVAGMPVHVGGGVATAMVRM
jgi:Carboxypeptidase regulatory-like domain